MSHIYIYIIYIYINKCCLRYCWARHPSPASWGVVWPRWIGSGVVPVFSCKQIPGCHIRLHLSPAWCPTGSVLGPLLFILYTADVALIAAQIGVDLHSYADDTSSTQAAHQLTHQNQQFSFYTASKKSTSGCHPIRWDWMPKRHNSFGLVHHKYWQK